ncbi:Uncharacterized phage-encoded protein [Sebaldella termitidis]|uniref:Phage regulatory protein, Rha family n=2 Tax=Sebaldella TaxID=32068 RepID=D1AR01_SEBTE|nr:phage regulatory protein, Rha family [Sebaldella termitidis ATCC 33386]SUI22985.1 Uncharacterized phage-encoded protein [Sebaldella termitidis]
MRIENKETITSLEVAELTNKEHKNILADIRDEVSKLGEDRSRLIFQPIEYLDNRNRKQPAFNITLDGVLQLGARYDAIIRFNLIQKVNELQNKIKAPVTMKEALLLALEQQEKIEALELKVIEDMPKVEFYDEVTGSKTTFTMDKVAKILNFKKIGRNTLFDILRKNEILRSDNTPYQSYVDRGWFRLIESKFTKLDGETCITYKTVVYQKGVDGILKLLLNLGYKKNSPENTFTVSNIAN